MAELIVKDVALRLGDNEILKGVSLAVPAGEVVALLGPSGSGKTTLLRAIAGLETPHRGSIAIGDRVFFDAARGIELPAEEARARPGVPVLCAVAAPHRVRQRRLWPEAARRFGRRRSRHGSRRRLSQIGLGASCRALSASALRRPAAARRHRARARLRAAGDPARRAVVQSRRQAARGSARLAAHADRHARPVRHPCHPRPGRGDGDRRSHRAARCRRRSRRKARRPRFTTSRRRCSRPNSWAATTGSTASWSKIPAAARQSNCSASG